VGEEIGKCKALFAGLDSLCACHLNHLLTSDRGQDAPVRRGRQQLPSSDGEDTGPRCLEHGPIGVEEERQLAGRDGGEAVEQVAVGPLVLAEAAGDDAAAQRGGSLGSGENGVGSNILRIDLKPRGARRAAVCLGNPGSAGCGNDRESQFAEIDPHSAIDDQAPRPFWQGEAIERLHARAQPPEMGIELDRSPGDDEHGLEDAPAGIGVGGC
jgi:hypothetical protein